MNPILAAAAEVQAFCRARDWKYCFIGGLANQRWGDPRMTQDVDLTLLTGFGSEASYVDDLLSGFAPRIPDARDFALRHRVLLLSSALGVPIDLSLGAMPFEAAAVERASGWRAGEGLTLLTCSAEDLIVFKAFAGRERDWGDIEGVILRQGPHLDRERIWKELLPLLELKEDREAAPRLLRLLGESGRA